MQTALGWSVALLSLAISCTCAAAAAAAPMVVDTTVYQQFTSQNDLGTKLRYVKDSGICETMPGVHQVSGYVDIGKNMSVVRAIPYISNLFYNGHFYSVLLVLRISQLTRTSSIHYMA
jgi:hypothetical protein